MDLGKLYATGSHSNLESLKLPSFPGLFWPTVHTCSTLTTPHPQILSTPHGNHPSSSCPWATKVSNLLLSSGQGGVREQGCCNTPRMTL